MAGPAGAARGGLILLAGLGWWAGGAPPVVAQGVAAEVRLGVVGSTPLARDAVVEGGRVPAVVVGPRPGPAVGLAVRSWLGPALGVELGGGWTFTELVGRQGGESWVVQRLGVGQGVVSLWRGVGERFHLRGGLGAIRYVAEREGLFREGDVLRPVLEVGAGGAWEAGGLRLIVEVVGQAHGFGTPALRGAGGSGAVGVDGVVYRFGVQAGLGAGRWAR